MRSTNDLQVDYVFAVIKGYEEKQVVPDMPGNQEVVPHVFLPILTQPAGIVWIRQQLPYGICRTIDAMGQQSGELVPYLERYAADGGGYYWLGLPQCFAYSEGETLFQ